MEITSLQRTCFMVPNVHVNKFLTSEEQTNCLQRTNGWPQCDKLFRGLTVIVICITMEPLI